MKTLQTLLLAGTFHATSAHYILNRLIVNNTLSAEFQYTRDVLGAGGDTNLFHKAFPLFGPENPEIICGRSSFPVRNTNIETAVIHAGDDASFWVSTSMYDDGTPTFIYHPGPGHVFLSKLPEGLASLNDYDGTGDWFKIAYAGPKNSTDWSLVNEQGMNFTIPARTPPGKYLMRMEQFYASGQKGQSQWFVTCAHVEIVGAGGGQPTEFVRFPNAYREDDPGVWFHVDGSSREPTDLSVYVELKPKVWSG